MGGGGSAPAHPSEHFWSRYRCSVLGLEDRLTAEPKDWGPEMSNLKSQVADGALFCHSCSKGTFVAYNEIIC